MIIEPTSAKAISAARSLKTNDYAFVKRSDGSFSYAILAYRCMVPFRKSAKNKIMMEECMVFVVSSAGSTKMVRKSQSGSVRLVSIDGFAAPPVARNTPPTPCQEISYDDWVPSSMISFVPQMDDECSLISSVSDRAREISSC